MATLSQRMLYEYTLTQLNNECASGGIASAIEEYNRMERELRSTERLAPLQRAFQATVQQYPERPFTNEQLIRLLMNHLDTIFARFNDGQREASLLTIPTQQPRTSNLTKIACPFCDFGKHLEYADDTHIECNVCDTVFEASLIFR